MAEISLSQLTSPVKSGNSIHIDFLNAETPVVLSTDVARHFQRRHAHILRDIDRLSSILPKSFREPNFGLTFNEVPGPNGAVRKEKAYLLTRDAFSLLVMGMTGKTAILWKLRYIEAFNAMDAAIRQNIRTDALEEQAQKNTLARESAYRQGYDEGRASALPDLLDAEARARRETLHLVWALGPVQKRLMRRALRYRSLGLSRRETARLLGISPRHTQELLKMADALGMDFPALPVQGSLLEGMA